MAFDPARIAYAVWTAVFVAALLWAVRSARRPPRWSWLAYFAATTLFLIVSCAGPPVAVEWVGHVQERDRWEKLFESNPPVTEGEGESAVHRFQSGTSELRVPESAIRRYRAPPNLDFVFPLSALSAFFALAITAVRAAVARAYERSCVRKKICARCRYKLTGLSEPRCPECAHPILAPMSTRTAQ